MTDRLVVTPFSEYDDPALIPQPSALIQGFPFHGLLSATVLRNARRLLNTNLASTPAGLWLTLYPGNSTLTLFELNHLSPTNLVGYFAVSVQGYRLTRHADFQSWLVMLYYQSTQSPHP